MTAATDPVINPTPAPASASLAAFLAPSRRVEAHRPWRRAEVVTDTWSALVERLAEAPWTVLGLWGEGRTVHLALHDRDAEGRDAFAVVSLPTADGHYPALGRVRPEVLRLERALADLSGLIPDGLPDPRPWLDHGTWPLAAPLGAASPASPGPLPRPYPFLPVEGESLHQIPVGPVHAGIIEPGHFRFTCQGETVVRLEERLGYVHKGIERLLQGATLEQAARLAGRVSGDSTVAYALAFARAVEAASGTEISPRAHALRAVMAELERVANHLGDVGAIANDAAFALLLAHAGVLREQVLRANAECFGHRLMMDRVIPGGVAIDLDHRGLARLRALVRSVTMGLRALADSYRHTPSLQNRTVRTGRVGLELVMGFGAGGYVGRASGRSFDARRAPGYPPYDRLDFTVPVLSAGDVDARVEIRLRELEQSLALIRTLIDTLPEGEVRVPLTLAAAGEGVALVEGFRGDILAWVRLGPDGTVARAHLRDPSWFQWPLLEAAIEGNIVADFPLCNKSFNCSYAGHDL